MLKVNKVCYKFLTAEPLPCMKCLKPPVKVRGNNFNSGHKRQRYICVGCNNYSYHSKGCKEHIRNWNALQLKLLGI